jgi:hypothetical protein
VRTLLPDSPPAEIAELLERRKRFGQDRKDEVWEGVLHMVPAPSHRHAAHGVEEVLIIDPEERQVHWLGLADGGHAPVQRSGLIDLGVAELAQQIDWP